MIFVCDLTEVLKLLLGNIQIFTSFIVNLSVPWPEILLSLATTLEFANVDLLSMSGACLSDLYFYDQLVIRLAGPLIVAAAIIFLGYVNYWQSAIVIEGVANLHFCFFRPTNIAIFTVCTYFSHSHPHVKVTGSHSRSRPF